LRHGQFWYYDAQKEQCVSPDSVELDGGLNQYAYVPDSLGLTCGKTDGNIDLKDVRYMQSYIKNQTGKYTALGNADALLNCTLKPSDLPPIKIWTLDHRRLAVFKLAGLDSVPFKWASPRDVANQMWKMTTKTDGKSIILIEILSSNDKNDLNEWVNKDLPSYFESMVSWIEDLDGYYSNQKLPVPENVNWKFIADILMAARVYE